MAILDFKEIPPPVKLPAGYTDEHSALALDDFEKFSQDFFQTIFDAKIIEAVSRGRDGGRDLIVEVNANGLSVRWMVSCKHKAHNKQKPCVYPADVVQSKFVCNARVNLPARKFCNDSARRFSVNSDG
jgi:hypothetical protein